MCPHQSTALWRGTQPGFRIGVIDNDLDIRNIIVRKGQSPFAHAVADALKSALKADAALINAGQSVSTK
jgi:hypothetical protein